MWGFQPHFRSSLKSLTETALKSIGVEVAPDAYLIGFQEGEDPRPQIWVEPEDRDFEPAEFVNVIERADAMYENHELRSMHYGDAASHERIHRELRDECRATAIAEVLDARTELDRQHFVGLPGIVDGFRVYPVVRVIRTRWAEYPALSAVQSESRVSTQLSLQHAVIHHVLAEATKALGRQTAPVEVGRVSDLGPDIVRHALDDFVRRLTFVHGNWDGTEFAASMTAVAAQPYEGRTGIGTVILAKPDHGGVDTVVSFESPIQLRQTRSFRKALEMTGPDLFLLSDGSEAYGLGRLSASYEPSDESRFLVQVVARGAWELRHERMPIARVDNGIPTLPRERISRSKFVDTVRRVFGECDPDALWDLAIRAADQQHGTMLVIHRVADEEAGRLAPQALAIAPQFLDASALAAMTAIDGAVLVAPDGRCHAVGVILDGKAVTGAGDAARGARYNSALRYHHGVGSGVCVIVIVSEDGMIDVLPDLKRQVGRTEVEVAVAKLDRASRSPVDFERASKAARHVRSLAFYLNQDQCDTVNAAQERVEQERERLVHASRQPGITRVGYKVLVPDAAMNDSYFLPA